MIFYPLLSYGFYATELIGMGVNLVTGDYSMGASGMLIEKGEITHAVSEVTIASNLKEIFHEFISSKRFRIQIPYQCPNSAHREHDFSWKIRV